VIYFSGNTGDTGFPPVVNILITDVNSIIKISGFNPLSVYFSGTPEITTQSMVNNVTAVKVQQLFTRKMITIKITDKRIFVLGSALWRMDSPGIYWPIVTAFIIFPAPCLSGV
jgi:hypothetical protein